MPFPPPPRLPSGPRRRSLLVASAASAAGAVLVTGCSGGSGGGDGGTGGSPSVSERARARAARDSAGLVARYDAVLAAHPRLAARLAPLRAEVVRHMEVFGGTGSSSTASGSPSAGSSSGVGASPSASGSPSVGSSSGAAAGGGSASAGVPGTEKDALGQLAAAERELADRRVAALTGVDGELARLLASVAAAGAGHAFLLTEGAA
ncbi:hypothetical protein ACF1AL_31035 [Streptomyces sp. NPDC014801]|uniref:hypothetical protein n=1 Tax=Streptomyces sp. NPDC014801 TaxID=3364916 RepID=UPI0036FAB834